jgi:hypothetical protein
VQFLVVGVDGPEFNSDLETRLHEEHWAYLDDWADALVARRWSTSRPSAGSPVGDIRTDRADRPRVRRRGTVGSGREPTMSKMDNLRAMREARYARGEARAAQASRARPMPPVAPVASCSAAPAPSADDPVADEEPCGHRNLSGRTCTREKGHAAKSHRYS